jgi:pantoate--beta-alanine ligase
VVLKLFNIVQPDRAYFGQKDAQQVRIIQQMVRDLNVPVELRIGPTVREPDGLALSSRNRYLDADQRRHAVCLHRALEDVERLVNAGEKSGRALCEAMTKRITATPGATLDYVVVVDADSWQPVEHLEGPAVAAIAVRFGATRLIDNFVIGSV